MHGEESSLPAGSETLLIDLFMETISQINMGATSLESLIANVETLLKQGQRELLSEALLKISSAESPTNFFQEFMDSLCSMTEQRRPLMQLLAYLATEILELAFQFQHDSVLLNSLR